nr:x box binding protein [Hymenolepis microstoma]
MSVVHRRDVLDSYASSVSSKALVRRRADLSQLSVVEKEARRKRLNRIAAQKARERNKERNQQLEERVRLLEYENFQIRKSCESYKAECEFERSPYRGDSSFFHADGEFPDIGSEVTLSSSPCQEDLVPEETNSVTDSVCNDEALKSFLDNLELPDYPLSPGSASILGEVVDDFLLSWTH